MRGGHIPGAVNVPFGKLVSPDDYSVRVLCGGSSIDTRRFSFCMALISCVCVCVCAGLPRCERDQDRVRRSERGNGRYQSGHHEVLYALRSSPIFNNDRMANPFLARGCVCLLAAARVSRRVCSRSASTCWASHWTSTRKNKLSAVCLLFFRCGRWVFWHTDEMRGCSIA